MRNLMLQTVISMLLLSIAFVGCEKEKENDKKETSSTTTTNKFTYNSKAYETPKGYLDKWGVNSDNESADFDVTLCSSSVNYSVELDEYSGTGHTVYIDLNSPSLTELAPGTYTYDTSYYSSDTATRKANTFVDAAVAVDYDFDNYTGTEYYTGYSSTGTVTIKKTDSTYEISYSFTLETGDLVEGYYKGSLNPGYDATKSAKKSAKFKQTYREK